MKSLSNLRFQTQEELTRIRNRIARWFSIYFPEYKDVYKDLKAVSGRMVLKTAPLPEDIVKAGCRRRKPDLAGCEAERRWDEEGNDPGISRRAQHWEYGSAGSSEN